MNSVFVVGVVLWTVCFVTILTQPLPNEIGELIVNGVVTTAASFPWMAAIQFTGLDLTWYEDYEQLVCGGSLINNGEFIGTAAVLTAAHCIHDLEEKLENYTRWYDGTWTGWVDIGRTDANDATETGYTRLEIIQYIYHENYSSTTHENDIGIVILDGEVTGVDTVELNTQPAMDRFTNGDAMRVVGYGADYLGGSLTETLEYADGEFVDTDTCNQYMRLFLYYVNNIDTVDWNTLNFSSIPANMTNVTKVFDGMMCSYDNYSDPCNGDSGGPLLGMEHNNTQAGVVSWSYGCSSKTPTAYADVGYYYEWIQTQLTLYLDTRAPTDAPTNTPSAVPSTEPTFAPSSHPTELPTTAPSDNPTAHPTLYPTLTPSHNPTILPTSAPTDHPSDAPTLHPTLYPTSNPTQFPTSVPTSHPTQNPTREPTPSPATRPPIDIPDHSDKDESSSSSPAVIALAVILSIVLCGIGVFVVVWSIRRDKDPKSSANEHDNHGENERITAVPPGGRPKSVDGLLAVEGAAQHVSADDGGTSEWNALVTKA